MGKGRLLKLVVSAEERRCFISDWEAACDGRDCGCEGPSLWLLCRVSAFRPPFLPSRASTAAWMSPSVSATALSRTDMGSPRQLCSIHSHVIVSFKEHWRALQGIPRCKYSNSNVQ